MEPDRVVQRPAEPGPAQSVDPLPAIGDSPGPSVGETPVVVEPDDWRLQGQERYLADRELEWSQWTAKREEWDHDHCEFCWAKFGPVGAGAVDLSAGYVTAADGRHWICPTCFDDFRSSFRWTLASGCRPPGGRGPVA
jgi:hypothetical protein